MSLELLSFSEKLQVDPLRWSICGGEDYRLLVNCRGSEFQTLSSAFEGQFAQKLYPIGVVEDGTPFQLRYLKNEKEFSPDWPTFQHF